MRRILAIGLLLAGILVAEAKDTVKLSGGRAERPRGVITHGRRGNTTYLNRWDQNGEARWTFTLDEPITNQNVLIRYGAPQTKPIELIIPGHVHTNCTVKLTGGMSVVRTGKIFELSLPAGKHSLSLVNNTDRRIMELYDLRITPDDPPRFSKEYPDAYEQKSDWATTMVAMRAKYQQPEFAPREDGYLSDSDGLNLWQDFPRETDWFFQDNQVHGDWGYGMYDARKDFAHYFAADRSTELEKKLVSSVLPELGDKAAPIKAELNKLVTADTSIDDPAWLRLHTKACQLRRQLRLQPLLEKTDQVIYAKHMNMGTIYLATETQDCPEGSELRIIDLKPEREGQPLTDQLLFDAEGGIARDPELSFDGKKMLFAWRKSRHHHYTGGRPAPPTGNYKIYEMDLATREMKQLTTDETYGADFEPCYLPNDDIVFSSARCVHEVTCGWGDCSNLFVMNKEGKYARRLGFDQTQTAFPHLLDDGRIVYTRRDYNDRGQSYGHALFTMNADGTSQTEYYGNNSCAPTSIQHTRQIPGTSKTMGVAGGYHTTQGGKLVIVDPLKGRQNYDGLTFRNWTPPALEAIRNENFCRVGEQYAYPYPFDENNFLVSFTPYGGYLTRSSGKLNESNEQTRMLYNLYFMTMDGKREILAVDPVHSCTQAIPVMARKRPYQRPPQVDYTKTNGICYVQNVYYGPSAEGIEPGSIKKLRVVKLFYKPIGIGAACWTPPGSQVGPGRKYAGYGTHSILPAGIGTASFDAKQIIGDVDVHADGSAMFEVPAREPIYFQLIDDKGRCVQTMRSWATLMPNERFSCVGCHEENDSSPLPGQKTMAMQQPPQKLQPVHNFASIPFSYPKIIQPIWDKHCISCHAPGKKAAKIDLTGTFVDDGRHHADNSHTQRKYHQSYLTLLKAYYRRPDQISPGKPNEWVNYYTRLATVELTPPYYAGSVKSGLMPMLRKGHGKTNLSEAEMEAVAAWIDLNVPYVGEYDEMNIWTEGQANAYAEKSGMRTKQEAIEAENIKAYIEAGQP